MTQSRCSVKSNLNNKEKPIAYASRFLIPAENNSSNLIEFITLFNSTSNWNALPKYVINATTAYIFRSFYLHLLELLHWLSSSFPNQLHINSFTALQRVLFDLPPNLKSEQLIYLHVPDINKAQPPTLSTNFLASSQLAR